MNLSRGSRFAACASEWGDKSPCMASSFLRELDRNYVQQFTREELRRAPVMQAEATSGFAALRAMMGIQEGVKL